MLLIRGEAWGTELTGSVYERGEDAPRFRGAPEEDAAYVWVCDEFYEVESGGSSLELGGRTIQVAFESPMPRGFDTRDQAVEAAKEHIRTQFARVGVAADEVDVAVEKADPE
ncbi:DUF7113 family protein [Halorarum halobium]|uniref:DUF7113 family protein n=1 Tax=Halorarum halobium TaxID=3075121 RepID=UPI0028B19E98|nr:hypothetical protein [Halobaculum sp. XH14]